MAHPVFFLAGESCRSERILISTWAWRKASFVGTGHEGVGWHNQHQHHQHPKPPFQRFDVRGDPRYWGNAATWMMVFSGHRLDPFCFFFFSIQVPYCLTFGPKHSREHGGVGKETRRWWKGRCNKAKRISNPQAPKVQESQKQIILTLF